MTVCKDLIEERINNRTCSLNLLILMLRKEKHKSFLQSRFLEIDEADYLQGPLWKME